MVLLDALLIYTTTEFNAPTTNTRPAQAAAPVSTYCLLPFQPSGVAKTTGTAITIKSDTAIKAKSEN